VTHRFWITEARKEQQMSKSLAASGILTQISIELAAKETVGKIDWTKFFQLIMELLPLIIALFAEENPTAK